MTEDAARKAPPPELREWQKRVVYLSPNDWFIGKLKSEGLARLLPSSMPENAALRIQQLVGTATGSPIGELDPAKPLGGKRRYRGGDDDDDFAATLTVDKEFEDAAAALPDYDSAGGLRRKRTVRRRGKDRKTLRRR
jgi:hypothetical protein